jgi:glucosamine--fructose-6-phosphate aminotransferase (isomerizing)
MICEELMCGIIGILGSEPVAAGMVDALQRLEYRGYDSAGVATLEHGQLTRRRAEGKLRNLEKRLAEEPLNGVSGIGHTRWATHGRPNEINAHPHATDRVAVVHNGIIENFAELRSELNGRSVQFATETDSEVVAHLVTEEMNLGKDPVAVVAATLPRLKGAFALAFLFAGEDDLLVGARRGSPLAIGHGKGESYLGSDAALAPFTNAITYLEDGDFVALRRGGATIRDATGKAVIRPVIRSSASAFLVDKGNHRHFMTKEIHEQPEVVGNTLAHYVNFAENRVELPAPLPFDFAAIQALSISACGTAYYAGLVGKYWFERFARLPVEIDIASEFRYREAPLAPGNLALFVSQSGKTADTLATLRYAHEARQHVMSVVNVATSTIARESDVVAPTLAGPEVGVASTKAFTCQLAVLACLAIAAGRARGPGVARERCACGATAADQVLARAYDHVELPPIKPVTTRINLHRADCRCCGNTITAEPPADMPPGSPFGPGIVALVTYLHGCQMVGYARLAEMLEGLFGLKISEGAIANMLARAAEPFAECANHP